MSANESDYIKQMITEYVEKLKNSEQPLKIFCIAGGRSGGKSHVIKEVLESSGLSVVMINSKDEVEVLNGEKAILLDCDNFQSDEEKFQRDLDEAVEQLRTYEMAPHSASDVIKSTILHQNKIDRDQARFRKRYQQKHRK